MILRLTARTVTFYCNEFLLFSKYRTSVTEMYIDCKIQVVVFLMVAYVSDKKKTLNTNKSYYIVRKVGYKSGLGKVRVNLVQ